MPSILSNPFSINGVLSTDKTALENLNDLCTAASSWLTYDVSQGKWCVVINRTGTSVASFDDSNIVGNINVSDTGINELYNAVSVEFPHKDLRDETDYVDLEINPSELFPNEFKNTLNMSIGCINDPLQAQIIGSQELKQSRVGKIIEFRTDFSKVGLKAGDLIDVTNEIYGFDSKVFRIVKIEENDAEGLTLSISALEYDEEVYNTDGLVRKQRSKKTGIILASQNEEIRNSNDVDVGNQLVRLLAANVGASLLKSLFNRILGTNKFGPTTQQAEDIDKIVSGVRRPAIQTIVSSDSVICAGDSVTINVGYECSNCLFELPTLNYSYEITGVAASDLNTPLTGSVPVNPTSGGSLTISTKSTAGGSGTQSMTVKVGDQTTVVTVQKIFNFNYTTTATANTITEGGSVGITLTTVDVPSGTVIPWAITGDVSRITSPLSGSVTMNGNQVTVNVTTSVTSGYTGNSEFIFTYGTNLSDPCGYLDRSAAVTVVDSTPAPPPDTECEFVEIPVVWCPTYDGATGQLKSLSPKATAWVQKARAGESSVAVPLAVSVTQGSTSTITVTSTVNVSDVSALGGQQFSVITAFNGVVANQSVTGSTKATLYGYTQ